MKRALLILAVCAGFFSSSRSQVISITVEEFYNFQDTLPNYPAGHTTYRIYANTTNANDKVTAVTGDDLHPLAISVTGTGIWNFGPGGVTGDAVACTQLGFLPLAEFDSYVSIGYSCDNDGSTNPMTSVEDSNQPWRIQSFDTEPHGNGQVILNTPIGGGWAVLPVNPNATAGNDLKILLAQITTDGDICGTFYLQEFPAGSEASYNTFSFSSNPDGCIAGCNQTDAINYNELADYNDGSCLFPCALQFNEANVITPVLCAGDSALVSISATLAQSFYNFNNVGLNATGVTAAINYAPGTYEFIVSDTRFDNPTINPNGLTCADTLTLTIVGADSLFVGQPITTDVSCFGFNDGIVTASFGGGTGDLTFSLIQTSPVADTIIVTAPEYDGLSVGAYYFQVSDANNCTASSSSFAIESSNPAITITSATTVADCFNSPYTEVTLSYGGGAGDVSFSLDANGPFDILGTNATVQLDSLAIGQYTIYAIDALDCTAQAEFEVVGAPAITITGEVSAISCFGLNDGELTVVASGGIGAFTYSFNDLPSSANNFINGLNPSTVEVAVQDANDCLAYATFVIEEPALLTATATASDVSCFGDVDGEIEVIVNGGTGPYVYALNETPENNNFYLFENLLPGSYIVHVIDSRGCSFVAVEPTVVAEPESLTASVTSSDACFGEANGSIEVSANGGTAPFEYSLNGSPLSPNNVLANLTAGDYAVTIQDNNGCVATTNASVSQPTSAIAIDGLSAATGGSSVYNVLGGTPPYSYSWVGPTGEVVSLVAALEGITDVNESGEYILTVTDDNGCTASQMITIIGVNEVNAYYQIQLYPNPNNGMFSLNMQGLTGETVSYTVLDNSGRVVVAKDLGSVGAARVENVDMMGAAAGIYQLRITVNGQNQSTRFVKQ
jgi:hypothetical protein